MQQRRRHDLGERRRATKAEPDSGGERGNERRTPAPPPKPAAPPQVRH